VKTKGFLKSSRAVKPDAKPEAKNDELEAKPAKPEESDAPDTQA
jgi:hypothetical protein